MQLIGIDTGGTFTDFVYRSADGAVRVRKLPSTPDDPSRVIRKELQSNPGPTRLIHGTTVATNTLLQRRGVRTALVTTRGFADVIEIGRQDRPRIYDLQWQPPAPLVAREDRFEVGERVGAGGTVLTPLDDQEVTALLEPLRAAGIEAIAVCFLFAPEHDAHEKRAATILRELGVPVVCSSEVLPELREYERFSTTTISAYVAPVMEAYLTRLAAALEPSGRLLVMASHGGARPWQEMSSQAVQTVLSGPAGGVVAAAHYGRRWQGCDGVVAFDMGGTSTDVSLVPRNKIPHTRAFRVDGLPVAVPVVDVHTIGAGGGSEAWVDAGGALRVGPRSAGAVPGPICYGRGGTVATVTDANIFLGRLPSGLRLGGEMALTRNGVDDALDELAAQLQPMERIAAARGIVRVVEAEMERALRRITQERGVDPRALTLLPFGGAAGLHAVSLARRLQLREVRVPPEPGVLSATGMLLAPITEIVGASVLTTCDDDGIASLDAVAADLTATARDALRNEWGDTSGTPQVRRELAMRYAGQSHELDVLWPDGVDPRAPFWDEYEQRYGFVDKERAVEVTTVRIAASLQAPLDAAPQPEFETTANPTTTPVYLDHGDRSVDAALIPRATLRPDATVDGPAIVWEESSTLWLPPGTKLRVDRDGTLILDPGSDEAPA
ncbi:MAG: hydantoinase/oxoprolinase family protein [Planctomycetota bacterium]